MDVNGREGAALCFVEAQASPWRATYTKQASYKVTQGLVMELVMELVMIASEGIPMSCARGVDLGDASYILRANGIFGGDAVDDEMRD